MWYNINYYILSIELLPTFLRKVRIVKFLSVLLEPINKLYYQWFLFRKDNLYKLSNTGQVCYLRKVLNDTFDPSQRRIEIHNGNKYSRVYIYTTAEHSPHYLGVMYLHPNSDYADTGVDFIVKAPQDLPQMQTAEKYELKALIDFYKEGVKRYKIEEL